MSIEAVSAQFVGVANYASEQLTTSANVSPTAHAADVASFRDAFTSAPARSASAVGPAAADPAAVELSGSARSILGQFDSLNVNAGKLSQLADQVRASGNELKPSQIIEMTMQAHQVVFQAELTSNVANRSAQGVEQLFRQQS